MTNTTESAALPLALDNPTGTPSAMSAPVGQADAIGCVKFNENE